MERAIPSDVILPDVFRKLKSGALARYKDSLLNNVIELQPMSHKHNRHLYKPALKYHLIWSTKRRNPLLKYQIQKQMYEYMSGIIKNLDGHPFLINGTSDHVHLLLSLHPKTPVWKTVKSIKTGTSKGVNEERSDIQSAFRWQTGYSTFTVSHTRMESVYNYFERQEEHHQNLTFDEAFQMLLDRHDIAYTSAYIP